MNFIVEKSVEILSVSSNLVLLFPVIVCLRLKLRLQALIWCITGMFSFFYHLCKIEPCTCFISYEKLVLWDHIFSATMVTVIVYEMVCFFKKIPRVVEFGIITFSLVVNIIFIHLTGLVGIPYAIYLLTYSIFIAIVIIVKGMRDSSNKDRSEYLDTFIDITDNNVTDKGLYVIGVSSLGFAFICFAMPTYIEMKLYYSLHSLWHICGSVGVGFILISMRHYLWSWRNEFRLIRQIKKRRLITRKKKIKSKKKFEQV